MTLSLTEWKKKILKKVFKPQQTLTSSFKVTLKHYSARGD